MTTKKPFTPKIKKQITLPLLKPQLDVPFYVRFDSPMFVGKELKGGEGKKMEPATLCNCTNLENDEECQLIINAVLKSILEDNYPDATYVGKSFQLVKGKKASGKNYNPFSVAELEI